MSIPPYGAGRRDLTRPDEQRAAAPERPAPVTVDALAAALNGREFLGYSVPFTELVTASRPRDLAVQLLTAIDPRLTDDAPAQEPPAARAAFEQVLRDEAGTIGRCHSAKTPCTFCEAGTQRILDAADAYATAAPELAADPTADDLAIASLTDERDEARAERDQLSDHLDAARAEISELARVVAGLTVAEAERNDLRQALDERNRQLEGLTRVVIDVTDRPVLAGLAAALRTDAGMTFIDQFSRAATPQATQESPGEPAGGSQPEGSK